MYVIAIIGIIGLTKVDIEKFVLKKFLNIKLDTSNIGHIIISKHKRFSIVKILQWFLFSILFFFDSSFCIFIFSLFMIFVIITLIVYFLLLPFDLFANIYKITSTAITITIVTKVF